MIKGLNSNLSVIDKRIASELHKKQIEGTLLAERVAYNFDRIVDDTVDQVLGVIASAVRGPLSDQNRKQAIDLFGQIGPRANESYQADAKRIAYWSFNKSVSIFAKNIPRKWFRQLAPEVVMVGERITIGPNVDPGDIEEPTWKKELTDEEWEQLLKDVLFDSPTEEQVQQIIDQTIAGKDTIQRLNDLSGLIKNPFRVIDDLAKGLSSSENLQQIAKRLEKQVQGVKSSARRIARTESLRVLDQMNRQAIEPLQDLLLGMQVLATLDQNTRTAHVHRHGRIYFYDRRRKPPIEELPVLPDEPNCRCWSSPVMKPPEGYEDDPALRAEFANKDGDSIPDPGVYTQWFDKSDLSARKLAVGSRRYREMERSLNGDREPEWTDFVDGDGKLLSIKQIRNEDDPGRAKRKQLVQRSIDKRSDLISQVAGRGFVDLKKRKPLLKLIPEEREVKVDLEAAEEGLKILKKNHRLKINDILQLAGVQKGAGVILSDNLLNTGVVIHTNHKEYKSIREIASENGKLVIRNEYFVANETGTGLGIKLFSEQVTSAIRHNVSHFETLAARGGRFIGYKVWPKMGYNAKIPTDIARLLPKELKGAIDIQDLLRTEEGRTFWADNGESLRMTFDIRSDVSQNWFYQYAKNKRNGVSLTKYNITKVKDE